MSAPPTDASLREPPKRPFGVYVMIGILLLAIAAAALEILRVQTEVLVGVLVEIDEFLIGLVGPVGLTARLFREASVVTVINGFLITIWVLVIVGLWTLQRWAWVTLIILTGLTLTFTLVRYFQGSPSYLSMIINVAVAFYLNDNSVQRAYARRSPGESA